ncbi:TPA: hypothetical protein OME29_000660 [Klebsiella oxytoca]|nr:hypothetical protein [Klebsiella oxytoca]
MTTDITELAQRMKAAAVRAKTATEEYASGHMSVSVCFAECEEFNRLTDGPDNILALVEAVEKAQKSNEFLKGQLSELANFNPDWDKLEASYDSWREIAAELLVAKERIAELEEVEQKLCAANVTLDARAELAERRLAEMESRTVTVKPMRPGHITVGGEKLGIYMRDEVDEFLAALTAAGIKWEAE